MKDLPRIKNRKGITFGFARLALMHILQVGLYFGLRAFGGTNGPIPDFFIVVLGFGFIQLVYVVPALWVAKRKHASSLFYGIAAAGLLTLGMQLAVWAVIFSSGGLVP